MLSYSLSILPIIIASVLIACFWKIIKWDEDDTTMSSFSKAIGESGYTDEENSIGASIKIEVSPDGKFYTVQYDVTDEEIANVKKILREKEIYYNSSKTWL